MVDTVVGQSVRSVAPAAGRVEAWLLPADWRRIQLHSYPSGMAHRVCSFN